MFAQVLRSTFQQSRIVLEVTEATITVRAKQSTNRLAAVTMVNRQREIAVMVFSADCATIVLRLKHCGVIGDADAVVLFEVLSFALVRVRGRPLLLVFGVAKMTRAKLFFSPVGVRRRERLSLVIAAERVPITGPFANVLDELPEIVAPLIAHADVRFFGVIPRPIERMFEALSPITRSLAGMHIPMLKQASVVLLAKLLCVTRRAANGARRLGADLR